MHPLLVAVLVAFAVTQVANLFTTIYLHRGLAHRALAVHPAVAAVSRVVIWVTTGIRPRQWVAVHRKHHAFTDVEGDPHSPVLLGWVRVQLANVVLYRREATDAGTVARYARDLPADRWDRLFLDRAWLGLAIGVTVLVVGFGPLWGPVTAVVHTVSYVLLSGAVNAVGHTFGRRPHANGAGNLQWLAWLTSGEGLHNNHHAAPTSARLALAPGEVDPGWWVVRLLRRAGLATVRHDRAVLKERAAA
jgi:stearoyl-CoA desaturase (delta-9 desaturase)